jgi:5-methylcytosine-specific restriction endonuclease McrA
LAPGVRRSNGKGCAICHREKERERYLADPEKARAQKRKSLAVLKADPVKYAALKDYFRQYAVQNAERMRQHSLHKKRRYRLGKNKESYDYSEILRSDPCSYCGESTTTIDHIRPSSLGGGNEWDNLTGACLGCNSRKRTRSLLNFLLVRETYEY